MILQNGMSAFDPSCVIGVHIRETLQQHFGWNTSEIEQKIINAMESVMLRHSARDSESISTSAVRWNAATNHDCTGISA